MLKIPGHGLPDAVLEICLGVPAHLRPDLVRRDGVAAVMTLPVGHICDQVVGDKGFSRIAVRQQLLQRIQHGMYDLNVLPLVMAADVVGLEEPALLLHHVDSLAVILHIQPVADILSVAVHRQRAPVKRVVDEKRDQLFRELIRSVVVAAVGDVRREMIGVHKRLDHKVRGRLRSRVGAVGIVLRRLMEILVRIRERAVHFVRGNMKELVILRIASVLPLPCRPRRVQHRQRAQHVGADEQGGILDAPVHMALGREMDHPVDVVLPEQPADRLRIADIRLHKGVVVPLLHISQVFQISRVCQLVHIDDPDRAAILPEHVMNVIGSDKAGSAGHEIRAHNPLFFPFRRFAFLLFFSGRPLSGPDGRPAPAFRLRAVFRPALPVRRAVLLPMSFLLWITLTA